MPQIVFPCNGGKRAYIFPVESEKESINALLSGGEIKSGQFTVRILSDDDCYVIKHYKWPPGAEWTGCKRIRTNVDVDTLKLRLKKFEALEKEKKVPIDNSGSSSSTY